MVGKGELKAMIEFSPEWIDKVRDAEIEAGSSFFPPDYIPKRFCTKVDKNGKKYPCVDDVVKYLTEDTGNLFEDDDEYKDSRKCVSYYKICE